MSKVMVRYKVKPERAQENERLIRAVYEELAQTTPAGLRYATFKLEDGVSFLLARVRRGDTVATIGAGDVDRAVPLILEGLA